MTRPLQSLRLAATAVLLLLAPASVLFYRLAYGGEVPDPVPTHWNLDGDVDRTAGLGTLTAMMLIIVGSSSAVGLACLALLRRRPLFAFGVVVAAWVGWLLATTYAAALTAAEGAATAQDVSLPVGLVVAVVLVPTQVALVVWMLMPRQPRPVPPVATPPSGLALRPGERVTWVGQASSGWMLMVAALLVPVAVSLVFAVWPVALAVGLAALAVAWAHEVTVRIDTTAVTVSWGPRRWPRVRIPLDQIAAAQADTIEPLAWGGWGYRITPRGRAAVVRRGPGLVLSRRDAVPFAVTVDDPQAGADLVNAVVAAGVDEGR